MGRIANAVCVCHPRDVTEWRVSADPTAMLQRRDHPFMVPYCQDLMIANPCNHSINVLCEFSRWMRAFHDWKEDEAAGIVSEEGPPPLLTLEEAAVAAVNYAARYASKPDNLDIGSDLVSVYARL